MRSIKDVAKHANVSISTVSNVINKTKYVSPELENKVREAIESMGYEVDPIARNMKTGRTCMVGIITADICGLFYPYVIKGIYEIANKNGYGVTIFDTNSVHNSKNIYEKEMDCFKKLLANRVDGIIFSSSLDDKQAEPLFQEIQKRAREKQTALVSIERDFSKLGIDSIFCNNVLGAQKAAEHLLSCGCKRLVHIAGPRHARVAMDRVDGYCKALELQPEQAYERRMMVACGDYTHQSGYQAMKNLLEDSPDLDGVFVANDQMAIGAMKFLQEQGRRIPEDIKLIGYDNVFVSSIVAPSLSTIQIDKKQMGLLAAERLLAQIEFSSKRENQGKSMAPLCQELETHLIVRKSSVIDAEEDWILADW